MYKSYYLKFILNKPLVCCFVVLFIFVQAMTVNAEEVSGEDIKGEAKSYTLGMIEDVKGVIINNANLFQIYNVSNDKCFTPNKKGNVWIVGRYENGETIGGKSPRNEFEIDLVEKLFDKDNTKDTISGEIDGNSNLYYSISKIRSAGRSCSTYECHVHMNKREGDVLGAILASVSFKQ